MNESVKFIIILIFIAGVSCGQQQTFSQYSSIDMEFMNEGYYNDTIIYQNGTLSPQFMFQQSEFSCANQQLFTYNQTADQFKTGQGYNLTFSNFIGIIRIQISAYYNIIKPNPGSTICNGSCTVYVTNNCPYLNDTDIIEVSVQPIDSILSSNSIKFVYNVICDKDMLSNPMEWGKIIIVFISTIAIFLASRFQQAHAYNNKGYYINCWTIGIYSIIVILSTVVVVYATTYVVTKICFWASVVVSSIGIMICFAQFMNVTRWQVFRWRLCVLRGAFALRVMDVIGIGVGIGVVCAWYYTGTNWIIGDFIYMCIFLAVIKLIKFGSLRMTVFAFITSMLLDISFIMLTEFVNGIYFNNAMLTLFNNPLFLQIPDISHYPNRKCSWQFLFSMAFPGLLLCYLTRFDKSRASHVYTIIFLVCYTACSLAWIAITINASFTLPYDLIIIPFAILLIVLFANRRAELNQLWNGKFYDEFHRHLNDQQAEIKIKIQREQSPSDMSYKTSMFSGLKYNNELSQNENSSRGGSQLKEMLQPHPNSNPNPPLSIIQSSSQSRESTQTK